eukprot:gene6151-24557_t
MGEAPELRERGLICAYADDTPALLREGRTPSARRQGAGRAGCPIWNPADESSSRLVTDSPSARAWRRRERRSERMAASAPAARLLGRWIYQ